MARLSQENREAQLIAVGRRVFANRSYDAVSIGDLATEAGMSKGLLYHYFKDKHGFYVAVLEEVAHEVLEVTRPAMNGDAGTALRNAIEGFVAYSEEHPTFYRALVRGGVGSDRRTAAIVEHVRTLTTHRILERTGLTESPKRALAVYGWVGFAEAVVLRWLDHREVTGAELVELLLQQLIRTLETL